MIFFFNSMRTIDEQGYHFEEWLTAEQIAADVKQVGKQISRDYEGKEPLFVVVLNGAFVFAADLIRAVGDLRCEQTFIRVSSYFGMATTGKLEFIVPLQQVVENRDVIIVEDILDTGCTLSHVSEMLKRRGAASVEIATFAIKDLPDVERPVSARYIGTHVPNEFVVGYGLDYAERYRNLPYVGILKPEVYA
jgi:hypoxanthine phosphoribosyltransferase